MWSSLESECKTRVTHVTEMSIFVRVIPYSSRHKLNYLTISMNGVYVILLATKSSGGQNILAQISEKCRKPHRVSNQKVKEH